MTLISILLAIWLDRMVGMDARFQFKHYFNHYATSVTSAHKSNARIIILLLPILIYQFLESVMPELLSLPFEIFALLVCLGCPHYRAIYKEFLIASDRGDQQACFMYSEELGVDTGTEGRSTVGQMLVWHNYQHYFAIFFWFAIAGGAGALFYCICREANNRYHDSFWDTAMTVLDWVPARMTALGYLIVGSYSRGIDTWMRVVTQIESRARDILSAVAVAADEPTLDSCSSADAIRLVRLAKRTTLLSLALIALATLAGWLS